MTEGTQPQHTARPHDADACSSGKAFIKTLCEPTKNEAVIQCSAATGCSNKVADAGNNTEMFVSETSKSCNTAIIARILHLSHHVLTALSDSQLGVIAECLLRSDAPIPPNAFLNTLCCEVKTRITTIHHTTLVSLLHCFSKHSPPTLHTTLSALQHLMAILPTTTIAALPLLILKHHIPLPSDFLAAAAAASHQRLSSMSHKQLAMTFLGLRAHGLQLSSEWLKDFTHATEPVLHSLPAHLAADLLLGLLAANQPPPAKWLDTFFTTTLHKLEALDPIQVLNLAEVLVTACQIPVVWFDKFMSVCYAFASSFHPDELTALILTLPQLTLLHQKRSCHMHITSPRPRNYTSNSTQNAVTQFDQILLHALFSNITLDLSAPRLVQLLATLPADIFLPHLQWLHLQLPHLHSPDALSTSPGHLCTTACKTLQSIQSRYTLQHTALDTVSHLRQDHDDLCVSATLHNAIHLLNNPLDDESFGASLSARSSFQLSTPHSYTPGSHQQLNRLSPAHSACSSSSSHASRLAPPGSAISSDPFTAPPTSISTADHLQRFKLPSLALSRANSDSLAPNPAVSLVIQTSAPASKLHSRLHRKQAHVHYSDSDLHSMDDAPSSPAQKFRALFSSKGHLLSSLSPRSSVCSDCPTGKSSLEDDSPRQSVAVAMQDVMASLKTVWSLSRFQPSTNPDSL